MKYTEKKKSEKQDRTDEGPSINKGKLQLNVFDIRTVI